MRYPLIDGQGNFGSVDGDSAAAMRYTEARLTAIAGRDAGRHRQGHRRLRRQLRRPAPRADDPAGQAPEPARSTARRGSPSGWPPTSRPTTWARSSTPTIALIDDPELTSDDLCAFVKGPDFPTGGSIFRFEQQKNPITGDHRDRRRDPPDVRPRPRPRGHAGPGRLRGGPPRPGGDHRHRAAVPGEQGDPAREDRGPREGQADRRHRRPARRVRPRRHAHLHRDQERRQSAHGAEQPLQAHGDAAGVQPQHARAGRRAAPDAPPKSVIAHHIEHRREIVRRRTEFDLAKARERAHVLEGLKIALDHLDEVDPARSASRRTSRPRGPTSWRRFGLSEIQAQAILDMRLARLAALERKKIEDEYLAVIQLIAELEDILANPSRVLAIIKDELDRAEAEVRRRAPHAGRGRLQPRDDRRGPHRRRGRRRHDQPARLHQAPAGRDLPPPGPRRARASSAT